MTDQNSSSVGQNSIDYIPGGSPRHYNLEVSHATRIPDSKYFFSDRKLSQLFNVDDWATEMDDDDNDLNDDTREPPPEPAPRGSYCPPSPGTPIVPPVPVDFGMQFRSEGVNGTFQNFSDDMALGMSRLSKISCGSSLTSDSDRSSIHSRLHNRSSTLGADSTPVRGSSPAPINSSRFSDLSAFTLDARSSRASSSLPSILSDIICETSHGIEDLFGDEDDLSLPHLRQWRESINGSDVNWQERCIELEISLQRFRDRAGKIRDILKEKAGLDAAPARAVSAVKTMNIPQQIKDIRLPDIPAAIKDLKF